MSYFVRNLVEPSAEAGLNGGFIELHFRMFANASKDSPIALTTTAIALGSASVEPIGDHFPILSRRKYGEALCATQNAVQHVSQFDSDILLMTILLLVRWEVSPPKR